MFCSACGGEVSTGARFCAGCGAAVSDSGPAASSSAQYGQSTAPQTGSNNNRQDGSADDLIGRVIDGKYRLDARIGAGGMGTVYRATRLMIGDTVAIKIMRSEFVRDDEAERFRREAQAAARLKHPNAVQIYDFGVSSDGLVYLVMELVEGESLRAVIKARGALAPPPAVEIAQQICAALDEAHEAHIVHRDVKPDNIIIRQTPKGLRVKLLDFGVAKMRDITATNLTQTGSVVGTPHYMSPEQCLGEEIDHRSDIYSLGVVLYEMLSGAVPFNSPVSTAVIVQHVNQPPPPLRGKGAGINPATEAAVRHALEKRREARPQSAGELAQELADSLDGSSSVSELTRESVRGLPAGGTGLAAGPDSVSDLTVAREVGATAPSPGRASRDSAPTVVLSSSSGASAAFVPQGVLPPTGGSMPATREGGWPKRLAIGVVAAILIAGSVIGAAAFLRRGGPEAGEASGVKTESPTPPPGMVRVPGGEFVMGNDAGDEYERPAHRVKVASFYIDKYEVTCEQYAEFMRAKNYARAPAGWDGPNYPPGSARHPVTGVTWDDANAYAQWKGKRLPTEEEWEFAARGTDGRRYPWGGDWRAGVANADAEGQARKRTAEVGQFEGGASPFGILDMAGNAWEWTATPLAAYPGGRLPPQQPGDIRVIRGGYWGSGKEVISATFRGGLARDDTKNNTNTGFRCAMDTP